MPQVNPKRTNIPVPANNGVAVVIVGTIMASKVVIMEDPALNAGVLQGLKGYYLDPNSNPANPAKDNPNLQVWLAPTGGQRGPAYQPILFGGLDGRVSGAQGGYALAQGSPILLLLSNSATATGIVLEEWP